ncbi:MAG: hypothetical protein HYY94_04330 [Gemmatimonadetes bacterium]|nr:hypothetical protein [Gemmatimonadota bacterium]
MERGGEGPLFAPLPPADELVAGVALNELKGMPPEAVPMLEAAGFKTLRDILDLEREDLLKIEGMNPELAEQLLTFLGELTEEGDEGESSPSGTADPTPEAPSPST